VQARGKAWGDFALEDFTMLDKNTAKVGQLVTRHNPNYDGPDDNTYQITAIKEYKRSPLHNVYAELRNVKDGNWSWEWLSFLSRG
jgi:hypothetical protein